jgi:malic enzyme
MKSNLSPDLRSGALVYHRLPRPGKIEIHPTKPLVNQRDLALAYSPGVAAACEAIVADPSQAAELTARGNLVAVITNGTAVLGLGAIGPLAAKPVMEGKAVLFKKFAGIDVLRHRDRAEAIPTSWSRSSPRWSRPSAASIWKTSRRRNASRSSQAAPADEDPGLP